MSQAQEPTATPSPFVEISRSDWAALASSTELPLTQEEIAQLRGLGDFLDIDEIRDVYLPLSRLLNLYVAETQRLHSVTSGFLGERAKRTPCVIGVAGSDCGSCGSSAFAYLVGNRCLRH